MGPLLALIEADMAPTLVVSAPDRRRSRRGDPEPTPVKAVALEHGIAVTDDVNGVVDAGVGLGVVVAFGQIIRQPVLDVVPMINVHFSLLPRWRGAAPVERAILAGDTTTGVAIMELVAELDAGAVYATEEVEIGADETARELRERLVTVGSSLLVRTIASGLGDPEPQVGEPVYAHKIHSDDLLIDWSGDALAAHRLVRVGGAWTTFHGERFKIHRTALVDEHSGDAPAGVAAADVAGSVSVGDTVWVNTAQGALQLLEVQPAGKPRMDALAWANGARLGADARLGS